MICLVTVSHRTEIEVLPVKSAFDYVYKSLTVPALHSSTHHMDFDGVLKLHE